MVAAEQREAEAKGVTGRDGAGHAGPEPWAFGTALLIQLQAFVHKDMDPSASLESRRPLLVNQLII